MKNLITVDFDIIMGPSIELYNGFVNEFFSIQEFSEKNNYLTFFCNADLDVYAKLTFYLYKLFENTSEEHIHFIYNHEDVYFYLEENEQYNVFNIDHHHDCGYPDQITDLYCGNWVQKMDEENKLNSYLWIANYSSSSLPNEKFDKQLFYNFDLYTLPNPDELIICASFSWVPTQFHQLFYMWLDFYNLYFSKNNDKTIDGLEKWKAMKEKLNN